ncbi:MAG: hypothetical protein ACOYVD_14440 [Bacillota bacterium]
MNYKKSEKGLVLYNLIFPLWAILFFTPLILIPLIGNLIIDGLIIYFTLLFKKTRLKWQRLRVIIFKAWIIGFGSDLLGFMLLLFLSSNSIINDYDPYADTLTILAYLFTIMVAGIMIFWLNYRVLIREGIERKTSLTAAIMLGILTAPWLFLIPTNIY